MLQKWMIVLAVIGLATAVAGCKRRPMTEFTSAEFKFKASFPGTPKVEERSDTATGIRLKAFMTEDRSGAYAVAVGNAPIPANESQEMILKRLDSAEDGVVKGVGGTLKSTSSIKLNGKYHGREFSASVKEGRGLARARIYLVGTRLYQVMVIGTNSYANSSEATAFLNSFKLVE